MIDKLQNQQQYSNINRTYNFNDVSSNNTFNGLSNVNNPSSLNGTSNNNALNTNLSNGLSNGGTPTTLSNGHAVSNGLPAGIPRPPNKHFPSWSSGETSQNSFQYMAQSPPVTAQNHTFQPTTTQNSNHMPGSLHSLSTSPLNGYSSPLFSEGESPDLSFLSSKSRLNSYINSSPPSSLPAAGLIPQIESMKVSDFLNNSMPTGTRTQDPQQDSFDTTSRNTPPSLYDNHEEAEEEEDLFTTFLTGSLNDFSPPMNDFSEMNGYVAPPVQSVDVPTSDNVWDYMGSISSPDNSGSRKNAWAKPLKFQEPSKVESVERAITPKEKEPTTTTTAPTVPTLKAPTVGRRMFELDDFDTAPRKAEPVKTLGDFQVVSSKRNKPAKVVKTPPPGIEKCSYGERCLFGTECSRWHSPEDQEAFNRQKLPNGARKCPWGAKCFRKLKCINYHTDKDVEQFKRE